MNNEEGFTSFECEKCHIEIEATFDMVGETTECPACGAKIIVPDMAADDGIVRHGPESASDGTQTAQKSRTIRIELGDL